MTGDAFADRRVRLAVAMTVDHWKAKQRPTKTMRLGKLKALAERRKRMEAGK